MSEQNTTSGDLPDAAAANPADEPVATPSPGAQDQSQGEGQNGEGSAENAAEVEPELTEREKQLQRDKDNAEKAKRSLERRIERMTRDIRQQQAAPVQTNQQEPAQMNEQEIARLIDQRAHEVAEQTELVNKCNSIFQQAVKLDKNFETNYGTLQQEVGPQFDSKGKPLPMMSAVLESDAPAKLLKHLTDNPDIAAEIYDLPPAKQIRRVALLEIELTEAAKQKPKQPSNAPKPPTVVKGAASGDEPDQNDTARWIEWDWKQDQAKRKR
jgi:hypothetical protein